jgi:hypothetical protein
MPELLQQPRTMVACTGGFDRDHCRRKLLEECEHLLASQLLLQNRLLGDVHSVKLENVLRRIHSNSANLFHGRLPLSEIYSDLILALLMPSGAVHTNRITRGSERGLQFLATPGARARFSRTGRHGQPAERPSLRAISGKRTFARV